MNRSRPIAAKMASGGLQVSPQELQFKFELRKNIPVILTLTNTNAEKVAFKVRLWALLAPGGCWWAGQC